MRGFAAKDLHQTILGKVTGARVNFSCRPEIGAGSRPTIRQQLNHCPNRSRVFSGTGKLDAPCRPGREVAEQFGFTAVLSDNEVDASITIEISHRRAALLTINADTTFDGRH